MEFEQEGQGGRSKKVACPLDGCGSTDAFAVYEDQHGHCFSCDKTVRDVKKRFPETWSRSRWSGDGINSNQSTYMSYTNYNVNPIALAQSIWDAGNADWPINKRKLSEETVKKFGVRLKAEGSQIVAHYYPYNDYEKDMIAFKERNVLTKEFIYHKVGPAESPMLFGASVYPAGGKKIIIHGGECDAMAAEEMMRDDKYCQRVAQVSLIGGDKSAKKSFNNKKNFEYVSSFETIYISMDNDESGRAARDILVTIFDPRKIRIIEENDDFKDANQALIDGKEADYKNGFYKAIKYRPRGVVSAEEIMGKALNPTITKSYDYPFPSLNLKTAGAREGEFVAWLAQTGVGKTSVFESIQYYWLKTYPDELKIANISIEKGPDETVRAILSLEVGKRLNHPDNLSAVPDMELEEVYKELFGTGETKRMFLFDGWGSIDIDELVSTIRYYANVLDCNFIFFDHLSMAVSDQRNLDERKALDEITTKLTQMVMETGRGLHVVSHMNDEGKARGSRNIDKVAWIRIDLTRDQDNPDPMIRNMIRMDVRKNRPTGDTGPAGYYIYDPDDGGSLTECDEPEEDEADKFEQFEKGI
ncbi:MAG: DnaB-like helicase C-terminal domain-containing protein [Nitrosopumilus sp.]